jgi:hypothetical protein
VSVEKLKLGSQSTVLNTGATLASAALAVSSAYNNKQGGGTGDGYPYARLTLNWQFGTAPAANKAVSVWVLTSEDDGTSYEDGGSSVTPARAPDVVFPVPVDSSAHQQARECRLPVGFVKFLAKNDADQTINSGWTLKALPFTRESV